MLIRKASASDKSQILEMTKATWEDGDYIKNVFDKWLQAPGEFTVLEDDGVIVGCTKLSITKPNNLWLEGIRVDPDKRRKGYAKILADYQLDLCKKMGFDHLNLSTWYQNESVKMLVHYPFEKIHEYKVLTFDQKGGDNAPIKKAVDLDQVLEYFKPFYTRTYYACDWTFFTLDPHMIQLFFDRGEIYQQGSDYLIVSDLHNKENSLSIVFVNHIDDELVAILHHLMDSKAKDYCMIMSDDEAHIQALTQRGFEGYDDEKFDVYLYAYQEESL